ncbi:MAG: cytochrome c biogenesis protein [Thermodesulfobacteriota bacterium]
MAKVGFYFILAGAVIQTINIVFVYTSGKPLAQGFDTTLYLFAWFISLVYVASQFKFKASLLGAFAAPLAFILTLPYIILPQGIIDPNQTLSNPWILIHIALILIGEALFTVAFISGVLYIFQENQIKSKHVGKFLQNFPSLTTLDRINHICLMIGFPLVTIGIALGLLLAKELTGTAWDWGHKETWSMVTWVLYALLIHGRLQSGWKGRKAAWGAILGFAIIMLTLFVIGYITPGQQDLLG